MLHALNLRLEAFNVRWASIVHNLKIRNMQKSSQHKRSFLRSSVKSHLNIKKYLFYFVFLIVLKWD